MPIARSAAPRLSLSLDERADLAALAQSRTAEVRRVERARILLAYAATPSFRTSPRPGTAHAPPSPGVSSKPVGSACGRHWTTGCCPGGRGALPPPRGRGLSISPAKNRKTWAPQEFWSEARLARYVREHAAAAGHSSAAHVQPGTLSKILATTDWHPHRVRYDLQRRAPDFDRQMVQV